MARYVRVERKLNVLEILVHLHLVLNQLGNLSFQLKQCISMCATKLSLLTLSLSIYLQPFGDTPTLQQLMAFPKLDGSKINILTRISVRYNVFGIFLLNDDDGSKTDALKEKCMRDSNEINLEISKKWLQGEGKWPVTWATFLRVLKKIDMKPLAFDIGSSLRGQSLRGKSSPQGRH